VSINIQQDATTHSLQIKNKLCIFASCWIFIDTDDDDDDDDDDGPLRCRECSCSDEECMLPCF